jgi:adenine deaminase
MDLQTFLQKLPKVELHLHLEGALSPSTFAELAKKHGTPLPPYEDPRELYRFEPTVEDGLRLYSDMSRSIRDRDDFRRLTYETLRGASAAGARYLEVFWSPMEHLHIGVQMSDQIAGIYDGIRDAETDCGVQCRMIAAINREETPEAGVELVQLLIENHHECVIGVSMDYNEDNHPPEKHWRAFRLAGKAGYHRTAHACEWIRPPRDVATCLDLLGCERIDHGYRTILDAEITRRCAEEAIVFTTIPIVCMFNLSVTPEERERRGIDPDECPLKSMVDRGLRVMFNSDDPGLIGLDLAGNYGIAMQKLGLMPGDLKPFVLNGIEGSWLDEGVKRHWKATWSREIDELLAQLE